MLMRCGTAMMGGATALGGMAMMAAAGPFLAGLGVGAALVGGAVAARKMMRRRDGWRDDGVDAGLSSTTGGGLGPSGPMPDEGEPAPI